MYASLAGKTDVSPSVAKKFVGPSAHKAEGGTVKESKEMMKKEVAFMKKKDAPKSMIKHEMKEAGMKKGGMPMKDGKPAFLKKMKSGGGVFRSAADGVAQRGKTKGKMLRKGGKVC